MNTMYSVVNIQRARYRQMAEKRQGQDLVRLYLPVELKEKFKLYCQLKGATMTDVIKEQIEELLEKTDISDLLNQRLKNTDRSTPEPPPAKGKRK